MYEISVNSTALIWILIRLGWKQNYCPHDIISQHKNYLTSQQQWAMSIKSSFSNFEEHSIYNFVHRTRMTVFWDDLFYHAFRIHSESRLAFSPRCAEPRDRAFVFHVQVKCVAIYYCQLLSTCVGYKCNWNLINT